MDKELLDSLARLLRDQRHNLLQEFRRAEAGLDVIAEERESELEEHAQEEQTARLLTRLDDRTLQAVKEIDAAVQRILDSTYGKCAGCHRPISLARLKALPATRFCKPCARKHGAAFGAPGGATEVPPAAPVPEDLALLTDPELIEAILEHLKEDGRIDMDELHVVCRRGVVYLSGALPSEVEHQILLQTLTDVMGFKEIVDHIDVEELLWENDKRTKEPSRETTTRWEEAPATEDVVESSEEGREFIAPAKPTPGEE
jgi:RNA polymerase-binding transcription factor DksA